MKIKTSIYLDEGLRFKWEKHFGGYASLSWLLETAIEGICEGTDRDPSFTEVIKAKIRDHVAKIAQTRAAKPNATATSSSSVLSDHRAPDR